MSQMSEAAKKRIEEINNKHFHGSKVIEAVTEAYQAGMQDPDANKELMEENKRLKNALKEISNSSPTLKAAMRTAHFVLGLQLPDDLKFKEDTRNDRTRISRRPKARLVPDTTHQRSNDFDQS